MLSIGLASIACLSGLAGAWYWWRSSRVAILPTWARGPHPFEPVDPAQSTAGWTAGLTQAATEAARFNAIGAIWTAVSVSCAGASALAGALGW